MENNNSSIAILADAKEEYTRQLINILRTPMYMGIKSIYTDAKTVCTNENRSNDVLMVFQELLSRIPKWSQEIINTEYNRITESSNCDWIEDLLKVIYVAHIKVLTIVNNANKNKKISLKIPNGPHFIHLCYIELAREFWKNPYLYSDRVNKLEYQKNMRECEVIIGNCVVETVRKQLPVRHILKEYFAEEDDLVKDAKLSTEEEDDIKKAISPKYFKKIETIVKRELKSSDNYETGMENTIKQIIKDELAKQQKTTNEEKQINKTLVASITEKVIEQTSNNTNTEDITNSNTGNSNTTNTDTSNSNTGNSNTTNTDTSNSNTGNSNTTNTDITNSNTGNSNTTNTDTSNTDTTNTDTSNTDTTDIQTQKQTQSNNPNTKTEVPKQKTTINNNNNMNEPTTKNELSSLKNNVNDETNDKVKSISISSQSTKKSSKTSLSMLLADADDAENETPSSNSQVDKKDEEPKLHINDINDINLNLNELDIGDLDNELEEVNLEVKEDPNTEYKFF
jgi:hypothetical protein